MWTTMGYNESINDFNLANAYNGRKLMPLVPRQSRSASAFLDHINPASPPVPGSSTNTVTENGKRELNSKSSEVVADVVVSTRWIPTPEQLGTLEDLYRRGTRTPSAEQIQHITAQLQRYGKIEGKNVFYWFQNHKARERQKRRRHQLTEPDNNNVAATDIEPFEKNDLSGEHRAPVFEIEQDKNWLMPTANCSTTLPQELLMSLERAGGRRRAVDDHIEYRSSSIVANEEQTWVQFDHKQEDEQLQQNINNTNENGRWQMPCPPQSYSSNVACNLINTSTTTNTTTSFYCTNTTTGDENAADIDKDNTITTTVQSQTSTTTLQLFPLQTIDEEDRHQIDCRDHPNMTYQYFEFLPLK